VRALRHVTEAWVNGDTSDRLVPTDRRPPITAQPICLLVERYLPE
jgi:hypothetical protein